MSDQAIIITGSSGLIGRALIEHLPRDFRIFGFDVPDAPPAPEPTINVPVDLTDDASVADGLERVRREHGERIASVVHLAAYYDFSGEPSDLYDKVTVQGTRRLLRHLRRFDVGQFIFTSTMLVHAPCELGQRIDERWALEPKWDYPKSKVLTEEVLLNKHGDIPVVVLRVAGVYDDEGHSIPIAHQIQRIYEQQMTAKVYPGNTAHGQAFVHLEDLVEAIRLAIEKRSELPDFTVMLIGEEQTLSYDELQHTIARLIHGESFETTQIPKTVAKTGAWVQGVLPGDDPFIKPWMIDLADDHYELNIALARQLIGWEPKRSLRDTLPKMIDALKANPEKFYEANKLQKPSQMPEFAEQRSE